MMFAVFDWSLIITALIVNLAPILIAVGPIIVAIGAVVVKLYYMSKTLDKTHALCNSAMGHQLEFAVQLSRRNWEELGKLEDKEAYEKAKDALAKHNASQAIADKINGKKPDVKPDVKPRARRKTQ